MKILLCDENRGFGGAERYLLDLAESLRRRDHQIHLFIRHDSWLHAQAADLPHTTTSFAGEADPRALWRLCRLQSREHFDIVHCHASRDLVVAALARRLGAGFPLVKSEHCFLGQARSGLLDWAYRSCSAILPVSQALKLQMQSQLPDLDNLQVLPNGISTFISLSSLTHPSLSPPERMLQGRWIGYVSSFIPGKGQADALEAALPLLRADPNLNLLLAGDGPLRSQVMTRVLKSGVDAQIWLPGHLADPLPYVASLEVVLLPSQEETFSLVCLEAMALTKPVVAYAVGGVPEVVEDGVTGCLVRDVEGMRAALDTYLQDSALARSHGRAGRHRVYQHFRLERVLDRLEQIYLDQTEA